MFYGPLILVFSLNPSTWLLSNYRSKCVSQKSRTILYNIFLGYSNSIKEDIYRIGIKFLQNTIAFLFSIGAWKETTNKIKDTDSDGKWYFSIIFCIQQNEWTWKHNLCSLMSTILKPSSNKIILTWLKMLRCSNFLSASPGLGQSLAFKWGGRDNLRINLLAMKPLKSKVILLLLISMIDLVKGIFYIEQPNLIKNSLNIFSFSNISSDSTCQINEN